MKLERELFCSSLFVCLLLLFLLFVCLLLLFCCCLCVCVGGGGGGVVCVCCVCVCACVRACVRVSLTDDCLTPKRGGVRASFSSQ